VEQYPQRWIFRAQHLAFDLDQHEDDDDELVLSFLDYPPFDEQFHVTKQALEYLEFQLKRLQDFYTLELQPLLHETTTANNNDGTTTTATTTLRPAELDNIMQYYNALSLALQMAVQAGKEYDFGFVNDNNDDDDDDDDGDNDDNEDDEIVVEEENGEIVATEFNENKWQDNRDIDEEEEDDDDDDEWSSDVDCPGGLFVKGRCVTDIKKWEEL
jgi:hypothetical protein